MVRIWNQYKKQCIVLGLILAVVLLFIYLRALFLPGLWHGDAFLYRQEDGSFKGSDFYAVYTMTIKPAVHGADIDFTVNDTLKHYQIRYDENDINQYVEVFEDGSLICKGRAFGAENNWFVIDEETGTSDIIHVRVNHEQPTEEELFPNSSRLYNWTVSDKLDTRGNPIMIFFILLLGGFLFIDIKFPDFFWLLKYGLHVDGGEPSDWYRFGQKAGYIVASIGILVCVVMTFTLH